jgi:hypothetical protein
LEAVSAGDAAYLAREHEKWDHHPLEAEKRVKRETASCFLHGDFDAALDRCPSCPEEEASDDR